MKKIAGVLLVVISTFWGFASLMSFLINTLLKMLPEALEAGSLGDWAEFAGATIAFLAFMFLSFLGIKTGVRIAKSKSRTKEHLNQRIDEAFEQNNSL